MELLLFILSTSGLTMTLVKGKIFKGVREYISTKKWLTLESIFSCSLCMGVYVGAVVYIIQYHKIDSGIILHIFAGSIVSNLLVSTIQYLDRK